MRRLCLLAVALLFGLGCATDADRKQWGEVWRDLRGDNMRLSTDGPAGGGGGTNEHR